jgi:16S rRNA (cytidine1402-2'-O)-methyltransferase
VRSIHSFRAVFEGFLPRQTKAKREIFTRYISEPYTLVFFESAPRALETLKLCAEVLGAARECVMIREATKAFEEIRRTRLDQLVADISERDALKGEITIVVAPPHSSST